MPNVQPAEASVEAFNNALFLFGDEIDALRNAKWKLRGFYQRNRSDVTAALGLLHVCQMLGDREEAVQLANELWGRRASLPSHERVTLAVSHLSLGQFERAVEFAASPENTSLAFPLEERTVIIKQAWSCTWNRDLFHNYSLEPV